MAMRWYERTRPYLKNIPKNGDPSVYTIPTIGGMQIEPTPKGPPGMAAEMLQTVAGPQMLHTNEGKIHNPDGTITVIPQKDMQKIQRETGMAGFATGGVTAPLLPEDPEAEYDAQRRARLSSPIIPASTYRPVGYKPNEDLSPAIPLAPILPSSPAPAPATVKPITPAPVIDPFNQAFQRTSQDFIKLSNSQNLANSQRMAANPNLTGAAKEALAGEQVLSRDAGLANIENTQAADYAAKLPALQKTAENDFTSYLQSVSSAGKDAFNVDSNGDGVNDKYDWKQDPEAMRLANNAYSLTPGRTQDLNSWGDSQYALRTHTESDAFNVDDAYDNYMASGAGSAYANTPGFEDDFKSSLSDAYNSGTLIRNSDGSYDLGSDFLLPWENPETAYRYEDFAGNDIPDGMTPDQYYSANAGVVIGKKSDGTSVTQGEIYSAWNSMSDFDKEKYYVDGKFDAKSFIRDKIEGIGQSGGVTITNSSDFANALNPNNPLFAEYGNPANDPSYTASKALMTDSGAPDGNINLLSNSGDQVDVADMIPYLWYQFSKHYNSDGSRMSFTDFASLFSAQRNNIRIDPSTGNINWDASSLNATPAQLSTLRSLGLSNNTIVSNFNDVGTYYGWLPSAAASVNAMAGKVITIGSKKYTIVGTENVGAANGESSNKRPLLIVKNSDGTQIKFIWSPDGWNGDGQTNVRIGN